MPSSSETQSHATLSSATDESRQRGPLGEQLTDAELLPIRVHTEDGRCWQVDYGSYVQGYHDSREEAIMEAVAASVWENRELTIARPRTISETASVLETDVHLAEGYGPLGSQAPLFVIGTPFTVISISPHDAAAIIDLLLAQGSTPAIAVAAKIEWATRSSKSTEVEVGVGEDEQLLAALDKIRTRRGPLGPTLTRLENVLHDDRHRKEPREKAPGWRNLMTGTQHVER